MDEKPIVKFQNKFWVVSEKRGEMLILWRDGKRALIHERLVTYYTNLTTHSYKKGEE